MTTAVELRSAFVSSFGLPASVRNTLTEIDILVMSLLVERSECYRLRVADFAVAVRSAGLTPEQGRETLQKLHSLEVIHLATDARTRNEWIVLFNVDNLTESVLVDELQELA